MSLDFTVFAANPQKQSGRLNSQENNRYLKCVNEVRQSQLLEQSSDNPFQQYELEEEPSELIIEGITEGGIMENEKESKIPFERPSDNSVVRSASHEESKPFEFTRI